jgi:hypothetical protein
MRSHKNLVQNDNDDENIEEDLFEDNIDVFYNEDEPSENE